MAFERLMWRACRGNVFVKAEPIAEQLLDPKTRETVRKAAFVIFFQGDQLKIKVKKICEAFHAKLYACPDSPSERRETLIGVQSRCKDIAKILSESTMHRRGRLDLVVESLPHWRRRVFQMRATYAVMNLLSLDVTKKCLIGECWLPLADINDIRLALSDADRTSGVQVPSILNPIETDEEPPTYFRTNKFTQSFQNIVDSYGTASYREVNPAPYTVITFPFLFAVMFGDLGHGIIMFLSGLFLVLGEKKLKKMDLGDIFTTFFGGRYVILLMGMFSMFTGIIYNEIYAKSANFVGSSWEMYYSYDEIVGMEEDSGGSTVSLQLDPKYALYENGAGCYKIGRHSSTPIFCSNLNFTRSDPPMFGFDPIWNLSDNKLLYINSFKMKMSVIIGIGQMTFGVLLSLINHVHFKDGLKIVSEFIPSIVFLCFLFVYLCVLIIVKWCMFWVEPMETTVGPYCGSNCAPALLMGFINSVMLKSLSQKEGFLQPNGSALAIGVADCDTFKAYDGCNLNSWYAGQRIVEPTLVICALLAVPVMLLLRPFVLKSRAAKEQALAADAPAATHENAGYENDAQAHELTSIEAAAAAGRRPAAHVDRGSSSHSANSFDSSVDDKPATSSHERRKSLAVSEENASGFDFGDVIVYQAIHTIEFALGCVSHTASYLRLWALSLAHSQLSEVLWSMVMRNAFTLMPGGDIASIAIGSVVTYVVWMAFSVLTLAVLILMEGLSAFLHALRLHWVEFQSKFYHGQGYAFVPFTFEQGADVAAASPMHD